MCTEFHQHFIYLDIKITGKIICRFVLPAHPHRLQQGDEGLVCLPPHFCQLQVELDDLTPTTGLEKKKKHQDKSRLCVLRLLKHNTLWLHKEAKTQNKHRPSYLETEAGFFLSLGDGRQLEEVPTNNELNASKRLRRPPHRPWLVTDIKPD